MGTYHLIVHPDTPPANVRSVDVRWVDLPDGKIMLRWQVQGCEALVLPAFAGKGRADGLWQTTCFELFVMAADGLGRDGLTYDEYNFSPSERWAAYRFDDYRSGMRELDIAIPPLIAGASGDTIFMMTVTIGAVHCDKVRIALSAVIEEADGTKSYWAFAHPPGKPDFHHPSCFTVTLPPPQAA